MCGTCKPSVCVYVCGGGGGGPQEEFPELAMLSARMTDDNVTSHSFFKKHKEPASVLYKDQLLHLFIFLRLNSN